MKVSLPKCQVNHGIQQMKDETDKKNWESMVRKLDLEENICEDDQSCKRYVPAMSYYMLSTTAYHAGKYQKEPAQIHKWIAIVNPTLLWIIT